VSDDTRIRESLPTIKLAIEKGARVVLASHLGRPKGKADKKYSLEPIAARLAELLDADVALTDEPVGDGARKVVNDLRAGAVAILENLRFLPGEEANDEAFSRELASYADVYVNDAFGTAHRAHASTAGITKFIAAKGMGLLMEREVKFLGKLLGEVERPFVAIIGGAKVSDKIGVLDNLLDRVDQMLIGGAMANTFLKARGGQLGRSLVEQDKLALARSFLKKAEQSNIDVLLPRDVVAAAGIKSDAGRVVQAMMVPEDLAALDIGPETARGFADTIARAKTIFWNGPMGVFESAPFANGTMAVAKAVAGAPGALSVVGGGDSVAAIHKSGLADKITHISTGGGASLEFLEGKKLPGLAALEQG
jgi:phosphoglycerate kinase